MDDQERSNQALIEQFRRERALLAAHPPRKPRRDSTTVTLRWLLALGIFLFVLLPVAVILIYPRFGPVDTMTAFCNEESEGNYTAAYALLSKTVQQRVSLDAFTQTSNSAGLGQCAPDHGIPLILGGTRASLDVGYHVFVGQNEHGVEGTMSFVREKGNWRVDSMTPDLLHLSS